MTTINMKPFQLPCGSTFDFMARMGVVCAADTSLAGVGGVPKSPRSKVRTRRVLNTFIFHLKRECFPPRMHEGVTPTYSAIAWQLKFYFIFECRVLEMGVLWNT